MIVEQATWSFMSRMPLTQWYGHVSLLNDRVVGQWLCLRRTDGTLLWQRRLRRANTILDVVHDVIVATEIRSDGPWTLDFGCYGISLHTGEVLWISHGEGLRGILGRLFDYVPGFTNSMRDSPAAVDRECVYCQSGRVLDVRSGMMLHRVSKAEILPLKPRAFRRRIQSLTILSDRGALQSIPLLVDDDLFLTRAVPLNTQPQTISASPEIDDSLYAISGNGKLRWQFRATDLGYYGGVIPFTFVPPFIYVVVSDSPPIVPIRPDQPLLVRSNPGTWHALTLDVVTGSVLQDVVLGHSEDGARIEDADDRGVLFSLAQRLLMYHRRRAR